MLPDDALIEQADKVFVGPRNKSAELNESYELGGVGISDTSEPFKYEWRGYIEGNAIYIGRKGQTPVALLSFTGVVTEISVTFDQNMRPTIAYVEDGISKLYWYDASLAMMTITEYVGIANPRVSLDDKRKFNIANSDIIFAYIADGSRLCYRLQRERYGTEHVLITDTTMDDLRPFILHRIGMGNKNRFLFLTN